MGIAQFTAGQRVTALELNQLPVVVSYLTTGSLASTNAETVIGTFTIPAGDPTSPGGYWWKVHAVSTAVSSPTFALRMRLGTVTGSVLGSIGASTHSAASAISQIEGWLGFEAIGSSGTFGCWDSLAFSVTGATVDSLFQTESVAINTTIANNIVVTGQFSVSSASNTATTKFGAMYRL